MGKVTSGAGRYAPSPSGPLHVGNLRTAFVAWAWARSTGRKFLLRNENLDPHRTGAAEIQAADLKRLGIDWDGPVLNQTDRFEAYGNALEALAEGGFVFECYCSRKEIASATRAPHAPPHHYPGTCAHLSEKERVVARRVLEGQGRLPAVRLAAAANTWTVTDLLNGEYEGPVDAFVLRRGDGAFAYNLACVVDDGSFGINQVVRGGDLLPTSPGQAYLASLLGYEQPLYGHVPLVVNGKGERLAKRDGAVTLTDLLEHGWSIPQLIGEISASLGCGRVGTIDEFLEAFSPSRIPSHQCEFSLEEGLRAHGVR